MKVSTPSISWHNRQRVASLDIQEIPHPTPKTRLASGGGDDKNVFIWEIVKNEKNDDGKCQVVCLADLVRHQNSVNIVRWSKDGKILASGDTDSAIYLWHFQEKSAAPDIFNNEGEAGEEQGENWCVLRILRGHLQDVVSLAWSSCSQYLVSSSTDSTAIVYDVTKGAKLNIISDHKGWVNGVAYDPLNKYIATICSDRVLRFYNTKSFKSAFKTYKCKLPIPSATKEDAVEKNVRLFHDDTFHSFYRRMDFSPDGQLLVVPSGVLEIENEAKISHCTYVFSRGNFNKPVLYLPNKEFSIAVRFCPQLFELRPVPRGDGDVGDKPWEKYKTLFALPYRMIYAVATQNTVMFYDTQQAIPFARVSKIHYIGLTDLTWSPDGQTCIVSSTDGFASIIEFKKGELGKVYVGEKFIKVESAKTPTSSSLLSESVVKFKSKEQPVKANKKGVSLITFRFSPKPKKPEKFLQEKKRDENEDEPELNIFLEDTNETESPKLETKNLKPKNIEVKVKALKCKSAEVEVSIHEDEPLNEVGRLITVMEHEPTIESVADTSEMEVEASASPSNKTSKTEIEVKTVSEPQNEASKTETEGKTASEILSEAFKMEAKTETQSEPLSEAFMMEELRIETKIDPGPPSEIFKPEVEASPSKIEKSSKSDDDRTLKTTEKKKEEGEESLPSTSKMEIEKVLPLNPVSSVKRRRRVQLITLSKPSK